jgi:deoxyadenosine/deoxycytidine kinase
MVIVSIEGLIGAGKSTVLKELRERGFAVITEPVDKWTFLEKFYKDHKKYALALQTQILLTFANQEFPTDDIVFVERSPTVSRYVFANMLRSEGLLTDEEMNIYSELYTKLSLWKPDAYIYLETPIDVCEARQAARGDSYKVKEQYLNDLERYYNIFFKYNDRHIINSNRPVEDIVRDVMSVAENMKNK